MDKIFKGLSIRFKLFLAYAAVVVVTTTLGFALFFIHVNGILKARIITELNTSNQMITSMVQVTTAASIKNYLRAISEKSLEHLNNIYTLYEKGVYTEAEARAKAEQLLSGQTVGKAGYIYCINSRGDVVVHPREQIRDTNTAEFPFIRTQMEKKKGYLEYEWQNPEDLQPRKKVLYMTYFPQWDWIISATAYRSEFKDLLSICDIRERLLNIAFGKRGYPFVVDYDGNLIVHPDLSGNQLGLTDAAGRYVIRELLERKNGTITYPWKRPFQAGVWQKIMVFNDISDLKWIVGSTYYFDDIKSPLRGLKRMFWFGLLLTVLVTLSVTLVVSSHITRPLIWLSRQMEQEAEDTPESLIPYDGNDEIGTLARSFNRFIDKLKRYRREIAAEINERKTRETELRAMRNFLSGILDAMPSLLIAVDGFLRVTQWNRKAEAETGIPRKEALGQKLGDVFPRLMPNIGFMAASIRESRIRRILKTPVILPDGTTLYEDVTVYPLAVTGKTGAVIRIDDVTERVRMMESLIQNEKLRTLGGVAAGLAHEINNPLAGVIQNAAVLENRLSDPDLPANRRAAESAGTSMDTIICYLEKRDAYRMIGSIKESGTRIAGIVENMLSFSRKGNARFTATDPVRLIDGVIEMAAADYNLNENYDFKQIGIEKDYEPDLPELLCESGKIQQVLLNLFNNGAHAMFQADTGKEPHFIIRLRHERAEEMLRVEISDNGPGMSESVCKQIFEPFFTTKADGHGTGLGLSISYFIITDHHGGTMDVSSTPGEGTTFIIRLPLQPPPSV